MNREKYTQELFKLSIEALQSLVQDTRIQVSIGLMSRTEAHDRTNMLAAVIMTKQIEAMNEAKNGLSATNSSYL